MELTNQLVASEDRIVGGTQWQEKKDELDKFPICDSSGARTNADPLVDKFPLSLLAEVQRDLVLLLAPFAPYLAHELWEMLGEKGSLLKAAWPKYDAALAKEDELEIPVQINGKLRSRITVPADATESFVLENALADEKIKSAIAGKQIVKKIYVSGKLVNVVVK
jgi:leucyl-tRNA synthetase